MFSYPPLAFVVFMSSPHLQAYMKRVREKAIDAASDVIVFPMVAEVLPNAIFRARDPLLLGCKIVDGLCRLGTPLCIPSKDGLMIGRITSIQFNHNEIKEAKKGDEVCLKIEADAGQQKVMYGRQFDHTNQLYSKMARGSIDQVHPSLPFASLPPPSFIRQPLRFSHPTHFSPPHAFRLFFLPCDHNDSIPSNCRLAHGIVQHNHTCSSSSISRKH